jgi:hypothetical protein
MGILDEAIREHLELKRQHGAGDSELKQLEDDAFGLPERPGAEGPATDALAEAPTAFMTAPEVAEPAEEAQASERPDLLEPAEEQAAAEHETGPEPEPEPEPEHEHEPEPSADSVEREEREAIAEQPTEHFDVEEELAASGKRGPSDEELIEEEMDEPRLAPVDPLGGIEVEKTAAPEPESEEDDAFWNEQRLSDELDQALDAPLTEASSETAAPEAGDEAEQGADAAELEESEEDEGEAPSPRSDSDVLEDTPNFLEDAPEDDELWFEQKPPKDFDFDD